MNPPRALVFGLSLVLLPCIARAANVSIQLEEPVVVVTPVPEMTPPTGTGELVVRVQGSDQSPKLDITDPPGTAQITKDPPPTGWREDPGGSGPRIWHFLLEVTKLPPNSLQKHTVKITVKGINPKSFPFWLTNRIVKEPQFQDPVKPWIVGGWWPQAPQPRCTSILVSPGDIPATGLEVLQSNLVRESPRGSIGLQDIWLCQRFGCTAPESVWVPARRAQTAWLCLPEDFGAHGKFTGTLTLGASHTADVKTINLELQKSDLLTRLIGFLLIFLGVGLSWWIKVLAKSRLNRYQALLPALALRARFAALLVRLDQIPDKFKNEVTKLRTRLGELQSELDEARLDEQGLPPAMARPWGQATAEAATRYKAFLEEIGAKLSTLQALVEEGVEEVLKRATTNPEDAVKTALRLIDAIADRTQLPPLATAREEIGSILSQLGARLQDLRPPRPLSYAQVQVQIERLSRNVWLAWALLTALGGLATLILTNPGFGTSLDLLLAFLWGVGVPAVLNQLTPDTVTTELGVSIPAS